MVELEYIGPLWFVTEIIFCFIPPLGCLAALSARVTVVGSVCLSVCLLSKISLIVPQTIRLNRQ